MTTHDRDKVIAAAKEAGITYSGTTPEIFDSQDMLTSFYAIAFETGRQAEREECAKVDECIKLREQVAMLRDAILLFRNEPILGRAHGIRGTDGYGAMQSALDATEPKL